MLMLNRTAAAWIILILVLAVSAGASGNVLRITNIPVFKKLSRPVVEFPHERHYEWGFGCLDCHHNYDGGINILNEYDLKPGTPSVSCSSCHSTPRDLERSYHRKCLGCHRDMKKRGSSYGPLMCGKCHSKKRD